MLIRQVAYRIYEWSLARSIAGSPKPRCIALVISDSDLIDQPSLHKLLNLIEWCCELGIEGASIYVSVTSENSVGTARLAECIKGVFKDSGFSGKIVSPVMMADLKGDRPCSINISIGYGGKHELTNALKDIMRDVRDNKIKIEDIDEPTVESHLMFKCEPDLFIRTSGEHPHRRRSPDQRLHAARVRVLRALFHGRQLGRVQENRPAEGHTRLPVQAAPVRHVIP